LICQFVGFKIQEISFKRVVFPLPDGPKTKNNQLEADKFKLSIKIWLLIL
jgi:hypothetical protein